MLNTQTPLIAEFLKDHQHFSRLLVEILRQLNEGKIDQARSRGLELDSIAGPHIAYEEAELYPRLAELGDDSTTQDKLVGQHHAVVDSLRDLISDREKDPQTCESIKSGFELAVRHAEHCGSLISLLSQLEPAEQEKSLSVLLELREQGKKWTELET